MLPPEVEAAIAQAKKKPVLFLTGAGISAESGIPTFRGPEGYWQVGSENYFPEQLATRAAFERMPDEIWAWYLYRRAVCRVAKPNPAHEALVALERSLGDRFCLVTQNVDGLHLRAGNTLERTLQIHGNIDFVRCADACSTKLHPMPAVSETWPKERRLTDAERKLLACPDCGARARPHVLWFDECYDEDLFRASSALRAANEAALLVVVGTAGATNLPNQIVRRVASRGAPVIVVNVEETVFSPFAHESGGADLHGTATRWLPPIVERLRAS